MKRGWPSGAAGKDVTNRYNLILTPMNKKTFTLAVIFLICALGWLGANVYWRVTRSNCVNVFDLVVGVLFVAAGIGMVYNEMKKKRCRHLDEVNRHQIP